MTSNLILYHTTHCPNCHAQEKILRQLQARDSELQIQTINLEQSPDINLIPAIRSVPTILINDYRFEGLMKENEIKQWLGPDNHDKAYINNLLKSGQLELTLAWLQQHPAVLDCIPELLADETLDLTVRIGLDAVIEQLAEAGELSPLTHRFGKLLNTVADSLCIDILHYLAMIGSTDAQHYIKTCLSRPHPEVQRVARELLLEITTRADIN